MTTQGSLFGGAALRQALIASLVKLDPRVQVRNPVMFVVEIGALITTFGWLMQAFGGEPLGGGDEPAWFTFVVALWLWLTVVFANLAEALAEGRGKAQADALRAMRTETVARLRDGDGEAGLRAHARRRRGGRGGRAHPRRRHRDRGHRVGRRVGGHRRVGAGDPRVGRRPQRGHRAARKVLSDRIVVEITQQPGESFLDRMIALVEGAERRKTPNEIALGILLAGLTLIFLVVS